MFVVVTVIGAWLGWELTDIRARRAAIGRIIKRGGKVTTCGEVEENAVKLGFKRNAESSPFWRRVLRDEPIESILVPSDEQELLGTSAKLFPEASVWEVYRDDHRWPKLFRDAPGRQGEIK
jgi:hypothetical protein